MSLDRQTERSGGIPDWGLAQKYGTVWVIQGPVFYKRKTLAWVGDEGERKIAVPNAAFKLVIRHKTEEELPA